MSRLFVTALVLLSCVDARAADSADAAKLTSEQRRGHELFSASCAFCHAERGHATALLAKRLGTENALLERRNNLTAELIRHVVRHGINSMPWYRRAELSDEDLALITAYLTRTHSPK